MNSLQEYYNFIDCNAFECKSKTEIENKLKELYDSLNTDEKQSVIEYLEKTWLDEPIVRNYHSTRVGIKPLDTLKPCLKRLFSELDLCCQDNTYQFDYVTITDSLVLKIEQLLRNFCEKSGISTFKLRDKRGEKLVMEKLLDDILDDLKPEKSTGFDEEDRIFIKYVLTEKAGLNLRNKVAHGLMDINEYTLGNILLLFCIILKVSKYKFTPITKTINSSL